MSGFLDPGDTSYHISIPFAPYNGYRTKTGMLNHYFIKRLLVVTLLITLLLCGLILLAQSLRFLDFVLNRGAPMVLFSKLMLSMLPGFLLVILPLSITIAVLVVYQAALRHREIIVMQTIGLNKSALLAPVAAAAAATAIVVLFIAAIGMPISQKVFRDTQYQLRNGYAISLLQEGTFTQITDDITIYVGGRKTDGTLENLVIHDNRQQQEPVTITAETGQLVIVDNAPRIAITNGLRQQINKNSGKFSSLYFESYILDLGALMPIKRDRKFSDKEKGLPTLWRGDTQDKAAAHGRMAQVLLTICLPLLAAGTLLKAQFSRRGSLLPITVTIVVSIVLWSITIGLKQFILVQPLAGILILYFVPIASLLGVFIGKPARINGFRRSLAN